MNLLSGAEAIAVYLFGTTAERARVYRICRTSRFPSFRKAGQLCASMAAIMAWIEAQERGGKG